MTEHEALKRRVDLSVVAASALILAGSGALVANVETSAAPRTDTAELASAAPVPGLVPAPARSRRVFVRRSRAS